MKKIRFLVGFLVLGTAVAQAQFQKVYSFPYVQDIANDLLLLPGDRTVIAGSTHIENDINSAALLLMLEPDGAVVWSEALRISRPGQAGVMAQAADGNFIVGISPIGYDTLAAPAVVKVASTTGAVVWTHCFNGLKAAQVAGLKQLENGHFALLMSRSNAPSINVPAATSLVGMDTDGNLLWEKTIDTDQNVFGRDMTVGASGDIWVVASLAEQSQLNGTLLIRFSIAGDLISGDYFPGILSTSLASDDAGNIWMGGITASNGAGAPFLVHLNESGNLLWSKWYDTGSMPAIELSGLVPVGQGEVVVTGHDPLVGKSNAVMGRIDASGSVVWCRQFAASGANDYLLAVQSGAQNELVAAGASGTVYEDLNIWLVKTDSSGTIPDCCQMDYSLEDRDLSSSKTPYDPEFTTILGTTVCSTEVFQVTPEIATVCPSSKDKDGVLSPTAFTPDNDGQNDHFRPILQCQPQKMNLRIFDRWGNLVFESVEIDTPGWDGMLNGAPAVSDVYIWTLEYELLKDGVVEKKSGKGDVLLLR